MGLGIWLLLLWESELRELLGHPECGLLGRLVGRLGVAGWLRLLLRLRLRLGVKRIRPTVMV